MRLFCLCTAREVKKMNFDAHPMIGANYLGENSPALPSIVGVLLPEFKMKVEKTGEQQFVGPVPHREDRVKMGDFARQHFPNVDVHRCEKCGSGVAVQG